MPEIIPVYSPNTLLLWYTMDNTTTNNGSARSRHNGILNGTAEFTTTVTAKRGTHSLLSNPSSNMTIPKLYLSNSDGLTISFWIIKPTISTSGSIALFGEGTNLLNIYLFNGNDGLNYNIYFNLTTTTLKQGLVVAQGIGLDANNWRFVVLTMTKSAGLTSTWKTYIYNATSLHYSASYTNMNYPTGAFTNCKICNTDCVVDDFRLYNCVLTPTQIAGIYANTFLAPPKPILAFGNNTVVYATDALSTNTWTATTTGINSTIYGGGIGSVQYGNGKWLLSGGTLGDITNPNVYYSTTLGGTWTAISGSSATIGGLCYCVAFGQDPTTGGNVWLAGGGTNGKHKISYILDTAVTTGGTWIGIYSNNVHVNIAVYCAAYGNGLWVAGGNGNISTIMYSTDPTKQNSWTSILSDVFISGGVAGQCRGIAYGNGIWVAVGQGAGNTMATSADGMTWTATASSPFSGIGNGVAYGIDENGAGLWVAVGSGTNAIVYSSDPTTTWTPVANSSTIFTTSCNSVTYTGGRWIAVGQGVAGQTMALSVDGKIWNGITNVFANSGISVYGEP